MDPAMLLCEDSLTHLYGQLQPSVPCLDVCLLKSTKEDLCLVVLAWEGL